MGGDSLQSAIEGWVASLDPAEFRALVARTREPTEPIPPGPPNAERTQR
jgi:hypothetical protein